MYQSAADCSEDLKPLWHVGTGRMLFAGCLHRNALHSHSASVLLAGLYDDFELNVCNAGWMTCRMAVVPAGTSYEFDARGKPLAVLYVEPNLASADGLAALMGDTHEVAGALIGRCGEVAFLRAIYEDPASPSWAAPAIAELVSYSNARGRRQIDRRVKRALDWVMLGREPGPETDAGTANETRTRDEVGSGDEPWPSVAVAARTVGLSTSRFQHLFKAEAGVSYRRYLCWLRMRTAVRAVVRGCNLTAAAHSAGYCDQAHFAHEFRRIFGAPASRSLANVRR